MTKKKKRKKTKTCHLLKILRNPSEQREWIKRKMKRRKMKRKKWMMNRLNCDWRMRRRTRIQWQWRRLNGVFEEEEAEEILLV